MNIKSTKVLCVAGFTLIEMIVVVAVLILLTGIAVPIVGATLRVAETESTTLEMEAIREATLNFYEDTEKMPDNLDDLVTERAKFPGWMGPYINVSLTNETNNDFRYDAWRRPYELITVNSSRITLRSWGTDRTDDSGADDDVDLTIDVTPVQRKITQQRLDEINAAIVAYNKYFRYTTVASGPVPGGGYYAAASGPVQASPSVNSVWFGEQPPGLGPWSNTVMVSVALSLYGAGGGHGGGHGGGRGHGDDDDDGGDGDDDDVIDTPLLGPWQNTFSQLKLKGLLPNDSKYQTDAWGNAFVCGPDPVQYVTSSGP